MSQHDAPIFIHYVYDMQRAIDFYQSVFGVAIEVQSPGWSTLDFGEFNLALHILTKGAEEGEAPIPHAGLNLRIPNLDDYVSKVEQAGGQLTEIREPVPHVPVRLGGFIDTEGNGFELRQDA